MLVTSEHFSWQYQYVPLHIMDLYGRKGSEMPTCWLGLLRVTITSASGWLLCKSVKDLRAVLAYHQGYWPSPTIVSVNIYDCVPRIRCPHKPPLHYSELAEPPKTPATICPWAQWLTNGLLSSLNLFRDYNRHNDSSWWYFLLWLVKQTPSSTFPLI